MAKDKSLENGIAFFGGFIICLFVIGLATFRIDAKPEVKVPVKEVRDSIDYKCPHCGTEVELTINN